jgi:CrcB protein
MYKLLLIGLGGAVGSVLRYLVGGWVQRATTESFPTGTLVVNVTGCFAIGFLGMVFTGTGPGLMREEYRVAILVGILGGYTTFSSFGRETFALAGDNQLWYAAANIILSNAVGLGAVWLGHRLAERLYGA